MEKSTEELLEEYAIAKLKVRQELSFREDKDRSLAARNERCVILKLSERAKKNQPFECSASMTFDEFTRLLSERKLTNLTWLDLSSNNLANLPAEIGQLTNLTSLDLSGNQLTNLPTEIGQLIRLTSLNLAVNKLTSLLTEIGQFTRLTSFNLAANKLTSLPSQIEQLTNLTWLDLSSNNLNNLPTEIGQLTQLTSLDLQGNQLTSLPAEIGQLTNLTSLGLYRNQLTSLPAEISQLISLTSLSLYSNQLTRLSVEILALKALKELDLRNNPLDCPPELLKNTKNPQSIINYFAAALTEKRRPVNETKLLVVGQGTVGKTSLIQRIVHGRFDPHENKTEGIAIEQWKVEDETVNDKTVDGRPLTPFEGAAVENDGLRSTVHGHPEAATPSIQINVWDFGGQEIMHATHQFFLTRRSLYLLVLDARSTAEENRVEYWLKIIQSFGGESPVLLVGNKSDQHPLDIARKELQEKYPNIVGVLETSAATGAGMDELKAAIAVQVNHLAHVHDMLPESWFNVKQRLEEQRAFSNFITQEKYSEICAENGIRDESHQRTLIGFLHDLGVVLHFQDDPRLQALGILNPQWVTNGVYKIINTQRLMQNGGVLSVSLLNEILNLPAEYPRDKRLYMVDMMKKFELCYNLKEDHTFLIPDLLPKDPPSFQFDGTPAFEYHYPVLPPSVLTRFIVRMNQEIDGDTVWRSGVLLQIGENRALVRADTEDRIIKISINGTDHTRRDALADIRAQLNKIHASIKGLNPEQFVPIPGAPHAKPVEYETLLLMERAGDEVYTIRDGAQLIRANISQMLNGVESEYERKKLGYIEIHGDVTNANIVFGDDNDVNINRKVL